MSKINDYELTIDPEEIGELIAQLDDNELVRCMDAVRAIVEPDRFARILQVIQREPDVQSRHIEDQHHS